ncbi:hypothetical protein CKO25_09700 [Thiocapsa imhoffii]|uniref:Calcineurin-like phosphoesterase domain-containing protein n=1 Tax=Thiocapsa imhoffii TaxID=382777 RepID=A0A9X0WII8_9GAMM|nr:hypothetical protein [Thiocapsa imhoffii]MBK1644919.1 hypothetical protein [Thiocapsa imhoffii]
MFHRVTGWSLWIGALWLATASAASTPVRFFALGDVPYFRAETPQMIDLLDQAVAEGAPFLIHVGDIKAGSTPCTDENLHEIAAIFRRQPVPVVYTPGDNEWTDCHRAAAGAHDPLARLQRVREIFFADPSVLRRAQLDLVEEVSHDAPGFPEQFAFMHEDVLFVALHVVGSNNGYRAEDPAAVAEFETRDRANVRFLAAMGEVARTRAARAMVLIFHANPQFERTPPSRGFVRMHEAFIDLMNAYPGPVLALHGDTHRFRHDHPLRDPASGEPFRRFVRAEVPGSPLVGGLWIRIDPEHSEVFEVRVEYPISRDRFMP